MREVSIFGGYTLVTLAAAVRYGSILERNRSLDSLSSGTVICAFGLTSTFVGSSRKFCFILTFPSV